VSTHLLEFPPYAYKFCEAHEAFKLPAENGNIFCIFMPSTGVCRIFMNSPLLAKTFNNAKRITISARAEVEDAYWCCR